MLLLEIVLQLDSVLASLSTMIVRKHDCSLPDTLLTFQVQCQRQNGSYPSQLFELNPFNSNPSSFDFVACSGDELDDIDAQIAKLAYKKFDLVTLTISGNDFGFGDIAVR